MKSLTRAALTTLVLLALSIPALAQSEEFKEECRSAFRTEIPASIRAEMNAAGWRIQMVEFVTDADPRLIGQAPRGYPAGYGWAQADAACFTSRKLLVFAEKRRNLEGEEVKHDRISYLICHECGHSWDTLRGGSSHPGFLRAYNSDIANIDEPSRKALHYFTQPNNTGKRETFAEAFAVALGGVTELRQVLFIQHFPATVAYVSDLLP